MAVGLLVWGAALAVGFNAMAKYELHPGGAGQAPRTWPSQGAVALDDRRMNLLLFVHPQCPCSEATLAELTQVLTECREGVGTRVFIYSPTGELAAWNDSALARTARSLPGVQVQPDPDGRIAAAFGAETSGDVLLFDRRGRLQFSGGITGARGHEGDNTGYRAVIARLTGREAGLVHTPVFGCALCDEPVRGEQR